VVTEESLGDEWAVDVDPETGATVVAGDTAVVDITNTIIIKYESAWAKAYEEYNSFCEHGFSNWGWSNLIEPGEYTWELWAGAAQCDTSKGTEVGYVEVYYDGDSVIVDVNVFSDFTLDEDSIAVYAGEEMFPRLRNGRFTTAPGQYHNDGGFDGGEIYVIVHANVGIPGY